MNSTEVCQQARVSYRQLDHWFNKGWIPDAPAVEGTGTARQWLPRHVEFLKIMGDLVRAGVYPEKAHQMAKGDERAIARVVVALARCPGGVVTWQRLPGQGAGSPETVGPEPCG